MSLIWLILLCALYMGWSMGANDAANCVGADIGSGAMPMRDGIILTCLFSLLGAVLIGSRVVKTIGKGIVPLDRLPPETSLLIGLTGLSGAALWVTIATYRKYPVSTSHSIVGAVAGGGLAFHLQSQICWDRIGQIVVCWLATPVGAMALGLGIYPVLRKVFRWRLLKNWERPIVVGLIYVTSAYLAFTWGGNDVANATGILVGIGRFHPHHAALIGGLAIVVGVTTWGYRVIETVGFRITNLSPLMTVAAEIASALNVHIYTLLGIPVSTSHSIVGAIWGVGFWHGVRGVDLRLVREIFVTWALTPVVSGLISFTMLKLILLFR